MADELDNATNGADVGGGDEEESQLELNSQIEAIEDDEISGKAGREQAKIRMEELRSNPDYLSADFKRKNPHRWQAMHDEIGRLTADSLSERDRMTPIERAGVDAAKMMRERQANLLSQAEVVMDRLVELGYERSEVPGDLHACELGALIAHAYVAQGKFDEFERLARQGLNMLPLARRHEAERLFEVYRGADAESKERAATDAIFEICSNLQQYNRLPRNCRGKATRKREYWEGSLR